LRNLLLLKLSSLLLLAVSSQIFMSSHCVARSFETTNNEVNNTQQTTQTRTQEVTRTYFGFATPEETGTLLAQEDEYTAFLQSLEIGVRNRDPAKTKFSDLQANYINGALKWNDDERAILTEIIIELRQDINPYAKFLPETVLLGKISTNVEGGLPHTRANIILLPESVLARYLSQEENDPQAAKHNLKELFLHELHHVMSRNNHHRHDDYFAIIGFKPCKFDEPESIKTERLTNPDAPSYKHYAPVNLINIKDGNGVIPYLSVSGPYSARNKGSLSNYFRFGLLAVNVNNNICAPAGDKPTFLSPDEVPDFYKLISYNTNYIIHPEEILADNFTYLILKKKNLPDPKIPEAIGEFWLGK